MGWSGFLIDKNLEEDVGSLSSVGGVGNIFAVFFSGGGTLVAVVFLQEFIVVAFHFYFIK